MIHRASWPAALISAALMGSAPALAAVQVIAGATPIVNGDASAAGDLTVVNEKLAFALAVQSAAPYGVPRGALVDLATVTDGRIGRDRVVFADFIPNHWSAWPNTYQHVEVVERGPDRVLIRTTRDWGKVVIATDYVLASNSDHIEIRTTMTNGGELALPDLLSGLTLWPNSGFLLSVPGLEGIAEGSAGAALARRVVAYGEDWSIALHASYFDHIGDASMDLYRLHTLLPGESQTFEGWLQVRSDGDLAPVVREEIAHGQLTSGRIHGVVRGRGAGALDEALVVVEKRGKLYAWSLARGGEYDLSLPPGGYTLYATAKNYSRSRTTEVKVAADSNQIRDFRDLDGPGRIQLTVRNAATGRPLDARIEIIEGQKPAVEFLGRKVFFTELDRQGHLEVPMAPGRYVLSVSSGGGFLGGNRLVKLAVVPGRTQMVDVDLMRSFDPTARGWYAADLHHHADQAEAVTPPADLARSQLAAGLDLLFVSDHDSIANHRALQEIADRRGIPFIPGVELSASWGHFNAYPLLAGQPLRIDTSIATVEEIFQEARRLGAAVVQVNHPFIPYGYLTSVAAGVAPGGFDPDFDLIEINDSASADDDKVMHALWDFWNAGHHYYLTAGTDTHDVWKFESGHVRAFAHVDGALSPAAFAAALKAGHGYVTRGPLVFPCVLFGEVRRVKPGVAFDLGFDLQSVEGLKKVSLIGAGDIVADKALNMAHDVHVDFPLSAARSTWYALVVEDSAGNKAYTDPIWVDAVASALALPGLGSSEQ